MKNCAFAMLMVFLFAQLALGATGRISEETRTCIECHASAHPGIVADWQAGRMAKVTPRAARSMILKKRRVSFDDEIGRAHV